MDVPQARAAAEVEAVRRFNRFYTRQIGLLRDGMVDTRFSLGEARVIYEIGRAKEAATATTLAAALGLDHGYLSRLLQGLSKAGLIIRKPSPHDRRQTLLTLSARGRAAFTKLDRGSHALVAGLLSRVPVPHQRQLIAAMQTIEAALNPDAAHFPAVLLRPHRCGDMGYVLESHARLYAEERGWGASFEILVAEIVHAFLRDHDAARERCWIAEMDGASVGCVFVVKGDEQTAKLRLLLVEPRARGIGLARRLVEECIRFAREAGYRRLTLWTQSILTEARALYQSRGFRLVDQAPHCSFGYDLIGETWAYDLAAG
jgi:DNA-binding MarR family transcriptional regulator/N-acetylglutamate synthase-like GNAT family acetyltransferase